MNNYCVVFIFIFFTQLFSMEEQPTPPFSPRRFEVVRKQDPRAVLLAAIYEGNLTKVSACLNREESDAHKRKECNSDDPFGVALSIGTPEIVHEFIKHGYSVNQRISYQTCTQSPRVKMPIEASKDHKHNRKKNKMLIQRYKEITRAIKTNKTDRLKKLLEKNQLFVDARFKDYRTALHVACFLHKADCAQILIENGANTNVLDANNHSPLYLAVHNRTRRYDRLLKLLLEHAANLYDALELAKKDNDEEALEILQNLSNQTINFESRIEHIN